MISTPVGMVSQPKLLQTNTPIKAFILAAGKGTRLLPLTNTKPKPLMEVGGKPVLGWIIDWLVSFGIKDICINLHYKSMQIMDFVNSYTKLPIVFSLEDQLLDTAGALKKMEFWLSNPFIVINGDTLTNLDLKAMLMDHLTKNADLTIFTHDDAIHSGGVYIFNKIILNFLMENKSYSIHKDLIPVIEKDIPTAINLYNDKAWYLDIGTREGLKKAREFFK